MKLVVNGALGRMGRMVVEAAAARPGATVVALLERPDHPHAGRPVPTPWGDLPLLADPAAAAASGADVGIDFSAPEASVAFARALAARGVGVVCGTTGMTGPHLDALRESAARVPVVWSPNTSLGVWCLHELAALALATLGPGYDVEIVEAHHRHKRDAPSGTALSLARRIADESAIVAGRQGEVGPRPAGEVGVHAVRGGEVAGDHTVMFLGDHERIEITHRASSRMLFAEGAVALAERLAGLPAGWFTVTELLRRQA
jgi:4-hydroxy-tetrahydrodipicolinate reductase